MKTLFSKLLAFALICAVACNVVGCKNYDDEIGAVNDRIDQLEGTVALKTDLQALQATVTAIENSYVSKTELAEALKAYAKPADIAAAVANVEKAMDEALAKIEDAIQGLQTASSKHQTAEQVAATVENMLNSYKIWADTEAYIKAQIAAIVPGLSEAEVTALLAAYVKTADLHAAILGWTGDELKDFLTAEALEAYVTDEALVEALEEYLTAEDIADFITADAVKDLIAEADNSEALKAAIIEAMTGEEGAVTVEVSKLNAAIEALAKRVEALEGKVQSIVWVPTVYEQAASGMVMFSGASYYVFSGPNPIDNQTTAAPVSLVLTNATKTLKFKVTPAAAAKAITAEDLTIDEQTTATRAQASEYFNVVSVEGDDNGFISVKVEVTDHEAVAAAIEDEKYPIISLNVKEDCASNYIMVGSVGRDATATLAYGNFVDGAFVAVEEPTEATAVYYDSTEPVTTLPAATAYFVVGDEYYELPEGVECVVTEPEVDHIVCGQDEETGDYNVTLDGSAENVGEVISLPYEVSIAYGEETAIIDTYDYEIEVSDAPAAGNINGLGDKVYALEAIFDGENYSFVSNVTIAQIKADLWEANKTIWEPYGYTEATFAKNVLGVTASGYESINNSEYDLSLQHYAVDGVSYVRVKCADTPEAKAWVGKGPQSLALKYTSSIHTEDVVTVNFTAELKMPEVTLVPVPHYVENGIATAYAKWDTTNTPAYVVYDKEIGPAYEWTCESAESDDIVLVYSIEETQLEGFQGTGPRIVANGTSYKLVWNDWNSLQVKVKVAACYANNRDEELESEIFIVAIDSPVGDLTAVNKDVLSNNPQDVDFAELFAVAMTGENANATVDILEDAAYFVAVGGEIEYTVNIPESAKSIVTYNEAVPALTFIDPVLHLTNDINIEVTAKFTDRFTGEEQTATATVTLKK
ncbi:MAG: hypothetical protein II299_04460 [Alistipes sp.]|nr:hypothetical protein [Alistipes sp.]